MFQVETISAKMLDGYVGRRDSLIIDLREEEEYGAGHIKGAVNLPYDMFDYRRAFPKEKTLVFYCDKGTASMLAAKQMAKMGYRTRSVIGGFAAYHGRNLVISQQQ